MKNLSVLIPLLLVVNWFGATRAQTRYDATIEVDSVRREFIISVPSGNVPNGGYPMVVMFHPSAHDGQSSYESTTWKEKGEAEKFITVFPSSLKYCVNEDGEQKIRAKWHCGELEELACPGQYLRNDVRFVRNMIDSIRNRFPVNTRRIYATGFSGGSCFTSKLAVEMSDVFAAAAGCGGGLSVQDTGQARNNIPVWFVLGTRDGIWLPHYQIPEFPFNDSTFTMLRPNLRRYLDAFNLTGVYTKDSTPLTLTYVFKTPDAPEPTTEFRFTLINGMGHMYPNGTNFPLNATNTFWDFFLRFSGPVSSVADNPETNRTVVYPNPAGEYITVNAQDGELTLTIRNLLGQTVFEAKGMNGTRMHLPALASGLYCAEITAKGVITFQPLVIR